MKTAPCFTACRKRWDAYVAAMIIGASLYAVLTFVLQKGSHLKAE